VQSDVNFPDGENRWISLCSLTSPCATSSIASIAVSNPKHRGDRELPPRHERYRLLRAGGFFRDNELLKLFANYRILHYEDVSGKADWGIEFPVNRLVRLVAQKPLRQYPAAIGKARST